MNEVPVALVTGGSRGIGRGIALRLAKDGLTVVINSRTADPADRQKGPRQEQLAVATNSAAISPAGTSGRGAG